MSVQINPNLEEAVSEIPPDIKNCLEETAYTAAKIGDARALEFERRIYAADVKNAVFSFLHPSDPYHACYKKKVNEYRTQPQPPVRLTCDLELPVRKPLFDIPDKLSFFPEAIKPKELGSIILTVDEESGVIRRCRKPDTSKEDLVDGFRGLLQAEGVGTALIDLRVLEYLANTEDKDLLHPSMMRNPPQQMQRPVAVPPPDFIRFVEHTARFVSSHDDVLECERRMLAADVNKESFSFLVSSDPYHAYYQKKLIEYRARFQPPVKEPLFDGPYNLTLLSEGIAPKELDYIKLTAMFVARFGTFFLDELMKGVANQPQFEFIKPADSRFKYYYLLLSAYSRVLRCSQKPEYSSADLVDDFLHLFQADEQQDEGAVMGMIDLPTFECVMDMGDNVLLLKHALNPPQ
ncbi:SWAP/Surp superfamily [Arabidopsis suecica]|uniref:SWAP/Surp superfamily n=1 Tax=Arabidopsis suecica TaxID=45249 RepID=A0A8T1Z6V0_ARASU|nr:SWAP/Surp superfamily [Arabidopsis suecica]